MELEMGARIAHIIFEKVEGGGNRYRGQWQGGRVSAYRKRKTDIKLLSLNLQIFNRSVKKK